MLGSCCKVKKAKKRVCYFVIHIFFVPLQPLKESSIAFPH